MASRYPGRSRKSRKSRKPQLIPIYYRIPGENIEIVSEYLETLPLANGIDSKRFFGHYKCENCRSAWTSGYSWQGYKLECKECGLFEWPTKVYHLENVTNDWVMKKPHLSSLCEKCRNDGVHCLTGFSLKPDTEQPHRTKLHNEYNDEYRNRYMIHFGKQLNLVKHDIIIEPLFIQDLFDCLWVYLSREERSEFKNALNIAAAKWEQKNSGNLVRMCRAVLRQTQ